MLRPATLKPRRCKHCRDKFQPERLGQLLHVECVDAYMAALIAKRQAKQEAAKRAAAKVERAKIRTRKEAIKTIPVLLRETQVDFNKFIRTRDRDQPCISCGKPPGDLSQLHAGRDAGHYRSVGSASHLRFHEDNCHAQCVHCNQWGAGRAVDYRIGLVARIGLPAVEALEADNVPRKWTREGLIAIRAEYKAKTKALLEATV